VSTLSTQPSPPAPPARRPVALRINVPRPQPAQLVLAGLIALEILIFSWIGSGFASRANFLLIPRLSVELGLLALAMTPVIVTGGIDLSVGSLMGLCAVLFGMMWRDAGMPPWIAATAAVAIGAIAGCINALLITRLGIPALIVTLGTFSLFRGIAEGLTGGVENYTSFPASFLFLGQGDILGIPAQVPILVIATIAFWVLLHRTTIGRALSAIGYNQEGARYAGIPVQRRVALTYVLTGLCSGIAAIVYVARVGQATADAGTGYELAAITAVVLGGTSIFGGSGSVAGTVLGLFAIAILGNGFQLANEPREIAGVFTGLLLLIAIGLDWRGWSRRPRGAPATVRPATTAQTEALDMRNSQVAVLCGVILAAALIVAGGNLWLVNAIRQDAARRGPRVAASDGIVTGRSAKGEATSEGNSAHDAASRSSTDASNSSEGSGAAHPITVAMMPKSKGNAYFIACKKGADEAAAQLGVNLLWDGPTDPDPAKQNEIVETWIARGVDVIAVAVENRDGISTALRKARQAGIKVLTWDSDAAPDARDFFVNQATPQGIGDTLMDNAARVLGNHGDFAIITASLTAENMNAWRKCIEARRAAKYPDIHLVATEPCDDKQQLAFEKAGAILNAHPEVKLIMAICSPAVPGAAEAVKQSGRTDVKVLGLGLPNDNKSYVHAGITDDVVLWNTMDLGYLTVRAAHDLKTGALKPGDRTMNAGRLGTIQIAGDNILLGKPFTFTKENIDRFDF
jgi:rhamnose transport system permease protein